MFLDHKILCFILHFLRFQINNLGAVGLTENAVQLLRWMVWGPEIARCVNEFESNLPINHKDNQKDHKHHEQTENQQGRFSIHLSNLIQVISEFGNPFLETSTDLLVLDARNIADDKVICTVNSIEDLGKKQFNEFVQNRLNTHVYSLYDPIKKNKLPLFSKHQPEK